MPLVNNVSNSLDKTLKEQLDNNFKELDKARTNSNGYEFNTIASRLNYLEEVIKEIGLPIDPREEKEMFGG